MRLRKWLGMFSNASPYMLPPGAARLQVNLQTVTPGQMVPRGGVWPVPDVLLVNNFTVGLGSTAQVTTLYRGVRTDNAGSYDDLVACVTDTGSTTIRNLRTGTILNTGTFAAQSPVSISQDRHGTFYFFQGSGVKPQRWSGVNTTLLVDLGIPAPDDTPGTTRNAGSGFYLERVNVVDGGAAYWTQPTITIIPGPSAGGTPAKLRAIVEAGAVTAINVLDPGSNYSGPVSLSFDADSAATNTFLATATLAITVGPGQYGMTSLSPSAITGNLTATHTVALGGNNKTANYFLSGNTLGFSVDHKPASLNAATQQWTASDVPIMRSTNFTDSTARATLVLSNATFTYPAGFLYGVNAVTSTNDGWNFTTNALGTVLPQASVQYAVASGVANTRPKIRVVDANGAQIGIYPLHRLGTLQNTFEQYYITYLDAVTGAQIRIYFGTTANSPTSPPIWGYHPDDTSQTTQYRLPTSVGRRFGAGFTLPIGVENAGSGYPQAGFTVYIARMGPTGQAQDPTETAIVFSTFVVGPAFETINLPRTIISSSVTAPGTGWAQNDTGYIELASRAEDPNSAGAPANPGYVAAQKLTLTVVQTAAGSPTVTGTVGSVNVINGGDKLTVPPVIDYQGSGYGLVLESTLAGQSIPMGLNGITVVNGGAGFAGPPVLSIRTGGAEATAIMRPTMVGKYQCAYRYLDGSVPPEYGGPIYSSFSEITEFEAGPGLDFSHTNSFVWSFSPATPPPARATGVELWRTSSDQSLVFYRVAVLNSSSPPSFTDTLSDEQLFNPDREQYAALPVVLPNGELNAYRFGQPRTDMAVGVAFQDRLFYGVSTSGENLNSIFFSEFDEFESCPDVNEVTIQQNVRQPDRLTALCPFGGQLLAFQRMHCYSLTYLSDPSRDGNLQLVAFRGCFNQQCWEIYDGLIYLLDEQGVYTLSPGGQVEDISAPIHDVFQSGLPSNGPSDNFIHIKIDPRTQVLRVFCSLPGDTLVGNFHPSALCYSLETKTWWIERFARRISCAAYLKNDSNRLDCVYGGDSRVVYLDYGYLDFQRLTVQSVTITNPGTGYTHPPDIVFGGNGQGGVFQAVLNDTGGVKAIIVKAGGTNYNQSSTFTTSGGGGTGCTGILNAQNNSTVNSGTPTNLTSVPWWYQSGNMELITDRESSRDGNQKSRAIALTYKPTTDARNVHLRLYYNNSAFARDNFARRDRGTGFVENVTGNSSVLNMQSDRTGIGAESTGVSIARFAGRGFDDSVQTDRHISIEIGSDPPLVFTSTQELQTNVAAIYEIDVQGVVE